ncbi:MAG: Crp/Fnr family transcriptional regulator [Flavobacteriaceae bacterium]|nr:MAG: Crp/Fnr family transcriptional regulator [Flavobacteriaceae bacterium]
MNLQHFLNSIIPFPAEQLQIIRNAFEKETLTKGHRLISEGETCKKLYYLETGLARSYYSNDKGKEITVWFFNEDNFLVGMDSFFNQRASIYATELLEDCTLYSISYEKLHDLFDQYHLMERFGRVMITKIMGSMVDRLSAIQFQTAQERYDFMVKTYPKIVYRAPLGTIASYLGITQETLSRIRSKQ